VGLVTMRGMSTFFFVGIVSLFLSLPLSLSLFLLLGDRGLAGWVFPSGEPHALHWVCLELGGSSYTVNPNPRNFKPDWIFATISG
jgi:hypothetical protein